MLLEYIIVMIGNRPVYCSGCPLYEDSCKLLLTNADEQYTRFFSKVEDFCEIRTFHLAQYL